MARPLRDSEYLFGLHDPGGEQLMVEAGKPGWVLFTEQIGRDPNDLSGKDFSAWSDQGLGVMVRLNNGYEPEGTIPLSRYYGDFARRCGNYVMASKGCHIWIIGNEMNFVVERPALPGFRGVRTVPHAADDSADEPPPSPRERPDRFNVLHGLDDAESGFRSAEGREVITPELYARCYRLCRDAIHAQDGHDQDQVLIGAVAPWNNQTKYDGNPDGDWIKYFQDILQLLGPERCDGITIHTYTHGDDPNLIYNNSRMNPPFHNYHYHFFAYRDFMNAIPASMRHLPVYITETDQDVEWRNENQGWIQRAYAEIDWWNRQPGHQQIRALVLYRWPKHDKWYIDGKHGVIEDFRAALEHDYVVDQSPATKPTYRVAFLDGGELPAVQGGQIVTTTFRLRNDGGNTWRNAGPNPVRLGYHWETTGGQPVLLPPGRDYRTDLPHDVEPGQIVDLDAVRVAVPEAAGTYRVRWGLVEEGVTWFVDRGAEEKVVTVSVSAPEEIVVPETGQRVREPFLAWYREHGLDVTGYPITEQFVDAATGLTTQYFQRVIMEEYQPGSIRLRLAGWELMQALEEINRLSEDVDRLQARIRDLEAQIGGGAILRFPQPDIRDITTQLPRTPEGFYKRKVSAIRYLVINHTGGPPDLPVEQLAGFHVQRGYPGLAYHYFIAQDGSILQTNPWTEAVSDQGYLGEGLNIAFAGKFNDTIPDDAQMAAAARLCAWLLQELGLTADHIKGVSEFVSHGSPGWQWLHGRRYKDMLLALVAAVEPEPVTGPPAGDDAVLRARIAELEGQVASLRAQLQAKEDQIAGQQATISQLQDDLEGRAQRIQELETQLSQAMNQLNNAQNDIEQLQSEVLRLQILLDQALADGSSKPQPVSRPTIHDVVDDLIKHPTKRYETRDRSAVSHICIHHSATAANIPLEQIAEYHVNSRDWPGIGYHFYVKPDGLIYQTNYIETVSYQVSYNNDYTVGVCVSGDFTYGVPTEPQLASASHLVAWLMQELDIPPENVMGHKEYPRNDTSCPGEQWLKGRQWKDALQQGIQQVATGSGWPKTLYHYMLFWQQPEAWAREDWLAAERYIGRFRPTTGFSIDDARHAEYVTIVGGVAGVSYEAEQMLRAAGCKVERLAGVDFADTRRILDELADSGRRFRDFPA